MVKNLPTSDRDAGDKGSTPGSGGSPGEENGNLLQYSCLESSMDRGAWQATLHDEVTKESDTTYQLNSNHKGSAEIWFYGGWKEDFCGRGNLMCKVQRKIFSSLFWCSRLNSEGQEETINYDGFMNVYTKAKLIKFCAVLCASIIFQGLKKTRLLSSDIDLSYF